MHMQKQGCPYYSPGFFPSPSLSASSPLPQGSSPTSWSRSSRSGCASPTAASWQRAWWDTCARTRPAGDSWGRSRRPLHSRRKLRCLRTPELREGSTPDGLFFPPEEDGSTFFPLWTSSCSRLLLPCSFLAAGGIVGVSEEQYFAGYSTTLWMEEQSPAPKVEGYHAERWSQINQKPQLHLWLKCIFFGDLFFPFFNFLKQAKKKKTSIVFNGSCFG